MADIYGKVEFQLCVLIIIIPLWNTLYLQAAAVVITIKEGHRLSLQTNHPVPQAGRTRGASNCT